MPYSDYERLAIPGGILDKLLGIEAPEMDMEEEQGYQGHDFIEGLAGMGQGMPPANTLAEGLLSGLSRGLGRQGTRLQTERKRFEQIAAERRKERDVANRQATKDYQRDRIQMLRDSSREERDEGRKKRDYERDNPIVTEQDAKDAPALRRLVGQPVKADLRQRLITEAGALAKEKPLDSGAVSSLTSSVRADPDIKNFIDIRSGYQRVRTGARLNTPQGDIAVIFGYMKMLDPGSVVREGEYANAQNSAGIPEWLRLQYNKALRGDKLTTDQRTAFSNSAEQLYQDAKPAHDRALEMYRRQGRALRVPEDLYLRDFGATAPRGASRPPLESFERP